MQQVLILGTHWLAEEIFDLISEIPGYQATAFVENLDRSRCERTIEGLPVVWVDDIGPLADTHKAICGISTTHRWRYVEQVAAMGIRFATLVHPTARVSRRAVLGAGCFVGPCSVVSAHAVIGEHVFMNRGVLIGHHTRLSDYVTVQPGANIAGLVEIGARTYVGMHAAILERLRIGESCVIGAGSVVTRDVPDRVQVCGVPARIVKRNIEGK